MTVYLVIGAAVGIVLAVVALWLGERGTWARHRPGAGAVPRRPADVGAAGGDAGDVPPERTEPCSWWAEVEDFFTGAKGIVSCGRDVPISEAHVVAGDVERDHDGSGTVVTRTYCAEHCPGGCVNHVHEVAT